MLRQSGPGVLSTYATTLAKYADRTSHCTVSVGIFLVNWRLQIGQGFVIMYIIILRFPSD